MISSCKVNSSELTEPGPDPAIHVDAPDKPGHDGFDMVTTTFVPSPPSSTRRLCEAVAEPSHACPPAGEAGPVGWVRGNFFITLTPTLSLREGEGDFF